MRVFVLAYILLNYGSVRLLSGVNKISLTELA